MLSQKIIHFLSNLPHFQHDHINDQYVATRLTDGTMFFPPPELEAQERGLIIVHWQGDINRQTITIGAQVAKLEIVEAVNYWIATSEEKNTQEAVQFYFDHFQYKTGQKLYGVGDEDSTLAKISVHLVKELGPEVIKKLCGI